MRIPECFQSRLTDTLRSATLVLSILLAHGAVALAGDVPDNPGDMEAMRQGAADEDTSADEEGDDESASSEDRDEEVGGGLSRSLPRASGLSARGRVELGRYEEALRLYSDQFEAFREAVARVVQEEYERQVRVIDERLQPRMEEARNRETRHRRDAIASFSQFAERYPDHPEFTGDVLFRLARLQNEEEQYLHIQALNAYDEQQRRYELGMIPEPPTFPMLEHVDSLATLSRLLETFPEYRYADAALYLLAIGQQDEELGMAYYERLIRERPDSEFVQESWLRIGELLFDLERFRDAREAYQEALALGPFNRTDLTLFKLGWTNYLLNDFGSALENFHDLLVLYQGDEEAASVLEEARQYYAIVLAERDWNLDGQVDEDFLMPRVRHYLSGDAGYELPVLDVMAELLRELEPREEYLLHTSDVMAFAVANFPLDRDTPSRHLLVYEILYALDYEEEAVAVLAEIAANYGPDSDWFLAMELQGEIEAMAFAERLGREAMLNSAAIAFFRGRTHRDEYELSGDATLDERAVASFRQAAEIYGDFLSSFPNDEAVYESRFFRARALHEARLYEDAVEEYARVRDSRLSEAHQEESAARHIEALTALAQQEVLAGLLDPRGVPDQPSEWPRPLDEGEIPEPESIPDRLRQLLASYDRYIELDVTVEDSPEVQGEVALAAARILLEYEHNREARQRFVQMFDRYCGERPAGIAALLLIQSYEREGDYRHMEYWANQVETRSDCISLPGDDAQRFAENIDIYRRNAAFANAERLREAGRYEAAAREFTRIAEAYPESDDAPIGLYFAGEIYEEELRRYDLAMERFRTLYERYPDTRFAEPALLSLAINSQQFFDFDGAIAAFRELHTRGFTLPAEGGGPRYPILVAAEMHEVQRQHDQAAEAYLMFVDDNPRAPEAPRALYRAAVNLDESGRQREMADLIERLIREHGTQSEVGGFNIDNAVIDGLARVAAWHGARNDARNLRRFEDRVLNEFEGRVPRDWETPEELARNAPARRAAADIAMRRAQESVAEWRRISVSSNPRAAQRDIERKRDGLATAIQEFVDVDRLFNDPDASICARLEQGRVAREMADFIFDLPVPDFQGDIYAEDAYMEIIEDIVRQYEEVALAEWLELYNLIEEMGVVNDCTIEASTLLNQRFGAEYPAYKQRMRPASSRVLFPGLINVPVGVSVRASHAPTPDTNLDDIPARTDASGRDEEASEPPGASETEVRAAPNEEEPEDE